MIRYRSGSIRFICRWQGSVFPNAILWSVTSSALAFVSGYLVEMSDVRDHLPDLSGVSNWWTGMTTVLGFLIVFRTQQAHSRYWEGATLVKQMQGELLEAATSIMAFCSTEPSKALEVVTFQHLLVRLMSMLYSSGLQTISDLDDSHFRMLDWRGIEDTKLAYLAKHRDHSQRCQILHLWVQRLVVENVTSNVLPIPTPVLSQVFQELSQGAVHLSNARKLTEVSFPFPYAQLISVLLLAHWVLAPIFATLLLESRIWAPVLTFGSVLAFWGINCIACELESPFGDDPNDLNLADFADDMNKSLWILLDPEAQAPPRFTLDQAALQNQQPSWRSIAQHLSEVAPIISVPLTEMGSHSSRTRPFSEASSLPGAQAQPQWKSMESMSFGGPWMRPEGSNGAAAEPRVLANMPSLPTFDADSMEQLGRQTSPRGRRHSNRLPPVLEPPGGLSPLELPKPKAPVTPLLVTPRPLVAESTDAGEALTPRIPDEHARRTGEASDSFHGQRDGGAG